MKRHRKNDAPTLFAPKCPECGKQLVPTPSGYLVCPEGHGKLVPEEHDALPEAEQAGLFGE